MPAVLRPFDERNLPSYVFLLFLEAEKARCVACAFLWDEFELRVLN